MSDLMLILAQVGSQAAQAASESREASGFGLRDGLLLAGVLLILVALFSGIRKKKRRGVQHTLTSHEHLHRLKEEQGVRGDLESLMVQIEQLAKRLGTQLDAKARHVESLIDQADDRIAALTRLQAVPHNPPPTSSASALPATPTPAEPAAPPKRDDLTQSVFDLCDAGKTPHEIAQETGEHLGKVELILALRRAEQREA